MAITTPINNLSTKHGKDEKNGSSTTVVLGGGMTNIPDNLNISNINANEGDISFLNGKNLTYNNGQFIYIGSESGKVLKISGNELIYALGKISELTTDNLKVNGKAELNSIDVEKAVLSNITANNITTNDLIVTGKAQFFELLVDKVKSVGGQLFITQANCIADYVKAYNHENDEVDLDDPTAEYYEVYFLANDNDGRKIDNQWEVNDQAICQSFNNTGQQGASYNISNKYYWRLVEGIISDTYMNINTGATTTQAASTENNVYIASPALYIIDSTTTTVNTDWNTQAQVISGVVTGASWTQTSGGSGQVTRGTMTTTNTLFGIQLQPIADTVLALCNPARFTFSCSSARLNVGIYYTDGTSQYFPAPENPATSYSYDLTTDASIETIVITNADEVEWRLVHGIVLSNTICAPGILGYSSIPSKGDNIAQLGYRYQNESGYPTNGTDAQKQAWIEAHQSSYDRASAQIISTYATPDSDVRPPAYAQYTGINDFSLRTHRGTYIDASGGYFKGNLVTETGTNIAITDDILSGPNPNMFLHTIFEYGLDYIHENWDSQHWNWVTMDSSIDTQYIGGRQSIRITIPAQSGNDTMFYQNVLGKLKPDTWYTISWNSFASHNYTFCIHNVVNGTYEPVCVDDKVILDGVETSVLNNHNDVMITGAWDGKRHYITFKTRSTNIANDPDDSLNIGWYMLYDSNDVNNAFVYCMPKLEEGQIMTTYIANEEDLTGENAEYDILIPIREEMNVQINSGSTSSTKYEDISGSIYTLLVYAVAHVNGDTVTYLDASQLAGYSLNINTNTLNNGVPISFSTTSSNIISNVYSINGTSVDAIRFMSTNLLQDMWPNDSTLWNYYYLYTSGQAAFKSPAVLTNTLVKTGTGNKDTRDVPLIFEPSNLFSVTGTALNSIYQGLSGTQGRYTQTGMSHIYQTWDQIGLSVTNLKKYDSNEIQSNTDTEEYIYINTNTTTTPSTPASTAWGTAPTGWTYTYSAPTSNNKYLWISKRTRELSWDVSNNINSTPTAWTTPELFELYDVERQIINSAKLSIEADKIELAVYDELDQKTGIDVENGIITLDADHTVVKGDMSVPKLITTGTQGYKIEVEDSKFNVYNAAGTIGLSIGWDAAGNPYLYLSNATGTQGYQVTYAGIQSASGNFTSDSFITVYYYRLVNGTTPASSDLYNGTMSAYTQYYTYTAAKNQVTGEYQNSDGHSSDRAACDGKGFTTNNINNVLSTPYPYINGFFTVPMNVPDSSQTGNVIKKEVYSYISGDGQLYGYIYMTKIYDSGAGTYIYYFCDRNGSHITPTFNINHVYQV